MSQLDLLSSLGLKDEMAPSASEEALSQKALLIHQRLCKVFSCPISYFHNLDPLSELVSALLSHRTRNKDSGKAFKQLRAALPTWDAVRDSDAKTVENAIAPCTWPEQKAPRIQQVLRQITAERGTLSLDCLKDMPVTEARKWLESLTGVGPKTSAAVLSFSTLRRRALPVDSHHHRVAQRTGLISQNVSVGPAHALLEAQMPQHWSAQQVYDNHEIMMLHGQQCCHYRQPNCLGDRTKKDSPCVLLDLCPFGQQLTKQR